jgi:hypothetical protein
METATMRRFVRLSSLFGALLLPIAAGAQGAPRGETRLGVDLLTSSLRNHSADSQGTGTRGWGGQVTLDYASGVLSVGADAGLQDVADYNAFTQSTTQGDMTSGVSLLTASAKVGLRIPPVRVDPAGRNQLSAGANVGYAIVHGVRMIAGCSDCTVQDLKVGGGAFVEPVVALHHGRSAFSARVRMFEGGADVRNVLILGYSHTLSHRSAPAAPPPPTDPLPAN